MDVATITRSYDFERDQSGTAAAQDEGWEGSLRALMDGLQHFPHYLRTIAQDVPAAHLQRRPVSGGFSMVEHACHLRDYENEGVLGRMQKILAVQHPSLPEFEGGRLAVERNYQAQNFASALHDFQRNRSKTLEALRSLSREKFDRQATIGTMGVVSIRGLVEVVAEHDRGHRQEIEQLLSEIRASV